MGPMTPPSKSDFFKQTTLKRLMVIAARADIRAPLAKPNVCSGLSGELAQAAFDLAQSGGLGLHSLSSSEHGRYHRLVEGIRLGTLGLTPDSGPEVIEPGAGCLGIDRLPRFQHQVGGLQVAGETVPMPDRAHKISTSGKVLSADRGASKSRRRPCPTRLGMGTAFPGREDRCPTWTRQR